MTPESIARMIDISAVQVHHGEKELRDMVAHAIEYRFKAVHALPCWTGLLRDLLQEHNDIFVGGPVGFPGGAHKTETKVFEAKQLIKDGIQEMDLMMNVGMLRSRGYEYVEKEIRTIVETAGDIPVKVILEAHHLTSDEIKKACELCIRAGVEFVKTGTGWTPGGATLEIISQITSFVGDAIKVKASGGIRDLNTFVKMYLMGVTRFGINMNASIRIIQECATLPGGILTV